MGSLAWADFFPGRVPGGGVKAFGEAHENRLQADNGLSLTALIATTRDTTQLRFALLWELSTAGLTLRFMQ
jgi:hypothetical protein